MESEKVKEIKKALEDNKTDHLPYIVGWKCKFVEYADILTLINELEKEVKTRKEEVLHLQEYGKKLIRETELKQFAERLKEKGQKAFINIGGLTASAKTVTLHDIDETLKELINE